MKTRIMIVMAAVICVCLLAFPVYSQDKAKPAGGAVGDKSNGTLEIIALYTPDFIVFKPAKGKKFKEYSVHFVSGSKNYGAFKTTALKVDVDVAKNFQVTFTDESEIRALFNISDNSFKAEKIKFIVDGKEMYYDLNQSKWE